MTAFIQVALFSLSTLFLVSKPQDTEVVPSVSSGSDEYSATDSSGETEVNQEALAAAEGSGPDSVCNPTIYYCVGNGSTQQQACDNARLCAIDDDACWYGVCNTCLKINTFPPSYQCQVPYKHQ